MLIDAYLSILLTLKKTDKKRQEEKLNNWQGSQSPPSLPISGAVPSVVHSILFDGEQLVKFS